MESVLYQRERASDEETPALNRFWATHHCIKGRCRSAFNTVVEPSMGGGWTSSHVRPHVPDSKSPRSHIQRHKTDTD